MAEGRKALHAYVSDEAHDQWHDFAAEQGVSVSAILEVTGPHIKEMLPLVPEARKVDAKRRRRSGAKRSAA